MKDEPELRPSGFNLSGFIHSPFVSLCPCGATSDVGLGGQLLCRFAVHLRSSAPRSIPVLGGPARWFTGSRVTGLPCRTFGIALRESGGCDPALSSQAIGQRIHRTTLRIVSQIVCPVAREIAVRIACRMGVRASCWMDC
jgi:hypothetical protein